MLPNMIVHKYNISFEEGGGGKEKKVSINGALENNHGRTSDREGLETLSMVFSTAGRTCYRVFGPLGS